MKLLALSALLALSIISPATAASNHHRSAPVKHEMCATCYGEHECNACKNCNYCRNCNSGGTLCGVYYSSRGLTPPWASGGSANPNQPRKRRHHKR